MIAYVAYSMLHNSPQNRLIESAAHAEGISAGKYQSNLDRGDRVSKSHVLTESDWAEARADFRSNNLALKLSALGFVTASSPKGRDRLEAISMAKEILSGKGTTGKISAAASLRNLNDPSWKEAAISLSRDPDPNVADAARTLLNVVQAEEEKK